MLTLTSPHARVIVSPYGGQVMSCVPLVNGKEKPDLLWQTTPTFLQAAQQGGKAMRGGIPLCWPWMGSHPTYPTAPSHGFGRLSVWEVESLTPTSAHLVLQTNGTHPAFPHNATATLIITITDHLSLTLTTHNTGTTPFTPTQALHTYLHVGNIETIHVNRLGHKPRTHTGTGASLPLHTDPLAITAESDWLYQHITAPIEVIDPALARRLTVSMEHTTEAVLWNPWVAKAQTLDMPPEDYQSFLCLESVHVATATPLPPGQTRILGTTLRWSPL